ncbi:MAG: hypothetical protein ACC653_00505 [Gammaproteobacteria bacterium]
MMTTHKETYLKCDIEITDEQQLTINKKNIEYDYNDTNKKWSSKYLPYSEYDSLIDLSKAITKDSIEFTTLNHE